MSKVQTAHPISFLATNADEVLKLAQASQEPVMITVNGKVEAVILDVLSYQQTQDQLTMLRILALGQKQIEEGKLTDHNDFAAQLEAEYGNGKQ